MAPKQSTKKRRAVGATLWQATSAWDSDTVVESESSSTRPSSLLCNCPTFSKRKPGQAPWCPHIEDVYRRGLDAVVWNPLDDLKQSLPRTMPSMVEVTLFVKQDTRLIVSLGDPDDHGLRKVFVVKTSVLEPEGQEFIGFIGDRQGRYSIRALVMEWLVESLETKNVAWECPSPFHFGDRALVAPDVPPSNSRDRHYVKYMANLACLLTTGFCYQCRIETLIPDVDE